MAVSTAFRLISILIYVDDGGKSHKKQFLFWKPAARFTDGNTLFSASTDKTVAIWDVEVGMRIKRLKGHTSFVNTCSSARRGPQLICSGSDDGTIKLWDARKRGVQQTFQNTYQVTATTFNDTAEQVISGGIDNDIKVWDLRKNDILYRLHGHADTITGLMLSPDGSYLLSNSMDNTLRIWDIRPFAPQERCVKIMQGHQHTFEKNLLRCNWSPDGSKVSAGSGDRFVIYGTQLHGEFYTNYRDMLDQLTRSIFIQTNQSLFLDQVIKNCT